MTLSSTLLKPQVSEIKNEYESLSRKLNGEISNEEMMKLNMFIQQELNLNEQLIKAVTELEEQQQASSELFRTYKRLKMNLRTAKRIWERLISNHQRSLKFKRKHNAASVAA